MAEWTVSEWVDSWDEEHWALFNSLVDKGDDDECWIWTGGMTYGGNFPQFALGDRAKQASHLMYYIEFGKDPDKPGKETVLKRTVDCSHPHCINPHHHTVSYRKQKKNAKDQVGGSKKHATCKRGHDLRVHRNKNGRCSQCNKVYQRQHRQRRKNDAERHREREARWAERAAEKLANM